MTDHQGDLELSLLRTFLVVVRHGSEGRAAAALSKTQPAVSHRILRLEKIIGRKLFARTRRGVKLTAHGEMLVDYANRAIDLNEQTLAGLRNESVSGRVRLGLGEEAVLGRLAPVLMRFQRAQPDVELKLKVVGPAEFDFLAARGELDFIIVDPARIAGQAVIEWASHLGWFAAADMSLDPISPLPLILSQNADSWREQILGALRTAGWEWRIVLEGANLDTTIAAVESGLGVAALLHDSVGHTAIREVKPGRLPALPEVNFGLFRGNSAPTRAKSLLEAALTASLKPAMGQRPASFAEPQPWLLDDQPKRERISIS